MSSEQRDRTVDLLEWCFGTIESSNPTTWSFEQVVTPLTVVSVDRVCDIGGFSEGARQAGCEVVLAIDFAGL